MFFTRPGVLKRRSRITPCRAEVPSPLYLLQLKRIPDMQRQGERECTCAGVKPDRAWGDCSAAGAREYMWCSTMDGGSADTSSEDASSGVLRKMSGLKARSTRWGAPMASTGSRLSATADSSSAMSCTAHMCYLIDQPTWRGRLVRAHAVQAPKSTEVHDAVLAADVGHSHSTRLQPQVMPFHVTQRAWHRINSNTGDGGGLPWPAGPCRPGRGAAAARHGAQRTPECARPCAPPAPRQN